MTKPLTWDGDNSEFVIDHVEALGLEDYLRQPIRWAYGYDGVAESYEKKSNGSSIVPDVLFGGKIKEIHGVVHDWLYHLHVTGRPDPSGKVWKRWECDLWYLRCGWKLGYPVRSVFRFAGLSIGGWWVWCQVTKRIKLLWSKHDPS